MKPTNSWEKDNIAKGAQKDDAKNKQQFDKQRQNVQGSYSQNVKGQDKARQGGAAHSDIEKDTPTYRR